MPGGFFYGLLSLRVFKEFEYNAVIKKYSFVGETLAVIPKKKLYFY